MGTHLNKASTVEEAQFREDVHAVLDEAGGPLPEDEILGRVRCRELQRAVDSLVEEGLLIEVREGHYFPTKKGREKASRVRWERCHDGAH